MGTEASACTRCRLAEGRRTVVFGTGNPDADLMFIGEGPGAEEDRQGLPFVGPAGQLLTRIIGAIGLARGDVYIANVVKCRPPGNRDPQPDEVAACRGFLEEQVRLVAPRVLVALGRIAAQTLLGNELPVGRMRGSWHRVFGVPLRVTYHPAALLRNDALKRPTWDDMQVVRDQTERRRLDAADALQRVLHQLPADGHQRRRRPAGATATAPAASGGAGRANPTSRRPRRRAASAAASR